METTIFEKQTRLRGFPPAQLFYILYRRLAEQGLRTTALWVKDKVVRRMHGYSPADISRVAPHAPMNAIEVARRISTRLAGSNVKGLMTAETASRAAMIATRPSCCPPPSRCAPPALTRTTPPRQPR